MESSTLQHGKREKRQETGEQVRMHTLIPSSTLVTNKYVYLFKGIFQKVKAK